MQYSEIIKKVQTAAQIDDKEQCAQSNTGYSRNA